MSVYSSLYQQLDYSIKVFQPNRFIPCTIPSNAEVITHQHQSTMQCYINHTFYLFFNSQFQKSYNRVIQIRSPVLKINYIFSSIHSHMYINCLLKQNAICWIMSFVFKTVYVLLSQLHSMQRASFLRSVTMTGLFTQYYIWHFWLHIIFTLYIKKIWFSKKVKHKIRVLIFSTTSTWNISHSTKNSERCHKRENFFM
jgi:hypothetical protein